MVDVSAKNVPIETTKARGTIALSDEAFDVFKSGTCTKGDVPATAKVAAIQAAKSTPALIPTCHPIMIEAVDADFTLDEPGRSVAVVVTFRSPQSRLISRSSSVAIAHSS